VSNSKTAKSPIIGGDGGLHDYVFRLPRETLIKWALTTEAYHRDVNHQHLLGGLDDYINTLANDKIADYIMKEVKEHPEIAFKAKLEGLSQKYNIDVNTVHNDEDGKMEANPGFPDKGLLDILQTTQRGLFNNWALALEKYHREVNNLHLMGGLHDYIHTLTDDQVRDYIKKELKEHPDVAFTTSLNGLVSKYNISEKSVHSSIPDGTMEANPGFPDSTVFDILMSTQRNVFSNWALALEKYHREVNNLHLMGGLHDYIHTLTDDQVRDYVKKELKEHPDVAFTTTLNGLVTKYNISEKTAHSIPDGTMEANPGFPDKELLNILTTTTQRGLFNTWALALEKYHREVNNQRLMGGLHDYISTLSDDQVRDYIKKELKEHPDVAFLSTLTGLVTKYNISEKKYSHQTSYHQPHCRWRRRITRLHLQTPKRNLIQLGSRQRKISQRSQQPSSPRWIR